MDDLAISAFGEMIHFAEGIVEGLHGEIVERSDPEPRDGWWLCYTVTCADGTRHRVGLVDAARDEKTYRRARWEEITEVEQTLKETDATDSDRLD